MSDKEWLKKNGFNRFEDRWVSSPAERDFLDNSYEKKIEDTVKVVVTYLPEEDMWECTFCILYFLDVETFTKKASTAENAFNEVDKVWKDFVNIIKKVIK